MKCSGLILILLLTTFAPCAAVYGSNETVEVKIGGSVRYSWWRPAWSDGSVYIAPSAALPASVPCRTNDSTMAPALMYGFTVSARFLESWVFSSTFMYGKFISGSNTPGLYAVFPIQQMSFSKDIKKYEFDALLGYRINRYFSVNLCVMTRSYDYIEKIKIAQSAAPAWFSIARADAEFIDVGPGLGLGVAIPLYKGLSLLINMSGLVLAGSGSYAYDYNYQISSTIDLVADQYEKESFYSFSGSMRAAFEYYFESAGLALQAGGRYDVTFYRHHRALRGFLAFNNKYDSLYGVTFATVYSFTFGEDVARD